jgi:hypothetical protein
MDSAGNYYTYSNVLLHLAPTDRDPVVPEQANLNLSSEAIKLTTFCRLIRHQAPHQRLSPRLYHAYLVSERHWPWYQHHSRPARSLAMENCSEAKRG